MGIPILSGPGFVVSDLSLATDGYMSATFFDVGEPLVPGTARAVDLFARFYGVDLRFAVDYFTKADGDLQLTEGLGALKASFARALVTVPGEIPWWPDYGIGITRFLNLRATAANIAEMKHRISLFYNGDPAVEEVVRRDVIVNATGMIEVFVDVKVVGQVVPIAIGISEA